MKRLYLYVFLFLSLGVAFMDCEAGDPLVEIGRAGGDACHPTSDPHFKFGGVKYSYKTGRSLRGVPLDEAGWRKILRCRRSRTLIFSKAKTMAKLGYKTPIYEIMKDAGSLECKAAQRATAAQLARATMMSAGVGACLSVLL